MRSKAMTDELTKRAGGTANVIIKNKADSPDGEM
jgi:hypothetical protein